MPTLTPDQLQEIRDIINRHHTALIARAVGEEALSSKERQLLEDAGMLQPGLGTIEDAYLVGHMMGLLESDESRSMGYQQFRDYARENPMPLTADERRALQAAKRAAAQNIRNLSDRVNETTGKIITETEQREDIREAVTEAVAERRSSQALASELGQRAQDWSRDWKKVAATELQTARQEGLAERMRSRHGSDVLVYKQPSPGACKH